MADWLFEAMRGGDAVGDGAACCGSIRSPIAARSTRSRSPAACPNTSTAASASTFGDLGPLLAQAIRARVASLGARAAKPSIEGIRATVIGASQYTTQVSGSTIYVAPLDVLPLRNVPVIAPRLPLDGESHRRRRRSRAPIARRAASGSNSTMANSRWRCSCRGRARRHSSGSTPSAAASSKDLPTVLARGHPLVLAGDGDVGGLIGIHFREEMKLAEPDGVDRRARTEGVRLHRHRRPCWTASGAVPVVIKSLIFPATAALGASRPLPVAHPPSGRPMAPTRCRSDVTTHHRPPV